MLRAASLLLSLLMFASALAAQEKFGEAIEVRVVNVDVVVTDRAGKRVTGLTKDDFQILEDGQARAITNFSEIRGDAATATPAAATTTAEAPAAAPVRPRRFLLFVDNYSLAPQVRTELAASLEKFVDMHAGPNDEISVVSWNRALNILAPFTRDREVVRAALRKVATINSVASLSTPLARVQKECMVAFDAMRSSRMQPKLAYDMCVLAAREHTEQMSLVARQLLGALNVSMNTLEGFDGKRALVLAGAQLPARPGMEIYQWANALFAPYMRGFDAAFAGPEEIGRVQNLALDAVAESANAHGVTLYMIAASVATDTNSVAAANPVPDGGTDFLFRGNTASAYHTLAELTGGLSSTRNGKFDLVLDAIANDLDSYYSLAYRPVDAVGKTARAITVKTKDRSYTVRSRKSWTPKTSDDQFADRVVANIYAPAAKSDFEVRIKAEKPRKQGDGYVVPIEVAFPPALTLLPEGADLNGGFTFAVAVGNNMGGLSTVFRQPEAINIKKEEEEGFRHTPITYNATLTLRRGENLVSVGVLDRVGRTVGFARTTIVTE